MHVDAEIREFLMMLRCLASRYVISTVTDLLIAASDADCGAQQPAINSPLAFPILSPLLILC